MDERGHLHLYNATSVNQYGINIQLTFTQPLSIKTLLKIRSSPPSLNDAILHFNTADAQLTPLDHIQLNLILKYIKKL